MTGAPNTVITNVMVPNIMPNPHVNETHLVHDRGPVVDHLRDPDRGTPDVTAVTPQIVLYTQIIQPPNICETCNLLQKVVASMTTEDKILHTRGRTVLAIVSHHMAMVTATVPVYQRTAQHHRSTHLHQQCNLSMLDGAIWDIFQPIPTVLVMNF